MLTPVVEGRADVNVRALCGPDVGNGGLNCVVGSKLVYAVRTQGSRREKAFCEHTLSISKTVLKAFSERPEMGARKLPAAPIDNAFREKGASEWAA